MTTPNVTVAGTDLLIEPVDGVNMEVLKELGARWDGPRGRWKLPASLWTLEATKDLLGDIRADTAVLALSEPPSWDGIAYHKRWTDLYDFQKIAARRLIGAYDAGIGQLLAMSPGLGKTATSIVAADVSHTIRDVPTLVICPASLVPTWHREIDAWSEAPGTWTVVSYEAAIRDKDRCVSKLAPWPLVIVDESIMIKSNKAKRTKFLHDGLIKSPKRTHLFKMAWMLSGSPIARYPDDLWGQLRMTRPKAFPSYWRFADRYCYVKDNDWGPGKVVVGPRAKYDAAKENADLMHVVNQEDVLDLPEYLFEAVDVPLTGKQATAYDDMLENFIAELETGTLEAENKIAQMTRLQQIVGGIPNSAKHDALVELIQDEIYKFPMLIWVNWKASAYALAERLGASIVTGDTPKTQRDNILENFKAGEIDILVLSLGVGKFGHTFTKTETVIYMDKTFDADAYVQSLRRVRRIGLQHRPVVVSLISPSTTDELVERNLAGKLGSIARMSQADLRELLRGLGKDSHHG